MRILLVNDDGVYAPGYRALALGLRGRGHALTCVAPDGNRSAVSHGLTNRLPIMARREPLGEGLTAWALSGTPADCVRVGLTALCPSPPDLVISGPNVGYNVGHDVFYSGTVGAALEGAMRGVKSLAVSGPAQGDPRNTETCISPEEVVSIFLDLLERLDVEKDVRHALNINLPNRRRGEIQGALWVPQSMECHWEDDYERRVSPEGREYYWIAGTERDVHPQPVDDLSAVYNGYIALTPLTYTLTDRAAPWGKDLRL